MEEEGIIAFAEGGHPLLLHSLHQKELGSPRPPSRTRGPREIGEGPVCGEAESIGGREVGVATNLAGPLTPLCLTLAEVGGEEARWEELSAPARLGTGEGGTGWRRGRGPSPTSIRIISRLLSWARARHWGPELGVSAPEAPTGPGPSHLEVSGRPSSGQPWRPRWHPRRQRQTHPEGEVTQPFIRGLSQLIRVPFGSLSSTMVAAGGRTGGRMERHR